MFNIVRYQGKTDYAFYCKDFETFYDAQKVCNFLNSKDNPTKGTMFKVVGDTYQLRP